MTDLPSYELVQRFLHETGFPIADPDNEMVFPEAKFMKLASRLIQHGADQELEACVNYIDNNMSGNKAREFRAARRPKPSLKEQALALLDKAEDPSWDINDFSILRQALEALPND